MDGMVGDPMAMAMADMPYFDPFMMLNHSGTDACSRVLQTRFLGVYTVSNEDKVKKEADKRGPYDPEDYFLVKPEDFRLMHKTIQSMMLCESAAVGEKRKERKEDEFVAILWQWQVAESIARKPVDFGRLVFTDLTTTRFVIVETCVHECVHVKQRAEQRAHVFFCLARYLGYAPKWVRYATSTPEQPNLPIDLLKPDSCQPGRMPAWEQSFAQYGFGQVDETNFKASLGQNALDAMEVIIQRSKFMAAHVAEDRQANGGLAALTQDVLQVSNAERGCYPNEAEPPLPVEYTNVILRHCANCQAGEQQVQLMKCSGCQMKWYCSRRCQKAHWKAGHKSTASRHPDRRHERHFQTLITIYGSG